MITTVRWHFRRWRFSLGLSWNPLTCFLVCLLTGGLTGLSFTTLPKTGWVTALALAVTNSVISFTVTSLSSLSVLWSTVSHHFNLKLYGTWLMILFRLSGLLSLLRYPISFKVLMHLVSCIENCWSTVPSSDWIRGPSISCFTRAVPIL